VSPGEIDELVHRCRAGDEAAWRSLVDEFASLVYSVPRRYKFDDADSADIFQTVFVGLFKNLHQIRDSRALTQWLLTTTQRACWKLPARTRADQSLSALELASQNQPAPPAELQTWERRHTVHRALESLGGVCEKLLRELYQNRADADYESVGARIGMPAGSIGPTRRRCLAKLAEILIEWDQFDEFQPDPS